ncbi:hypothetical protein ACFZAX_35370, partial [Streptomyces sp. NPDC008125]
MIDAWSWLNYKPVIADAGRPHRATLLPEGDFGDRAWDVAVALIQCGAVILRCRVEQAVRYTPRLWRLTEIWE